MADEIDDIGADIRAAMASTETVEPLETSILPADTQEDAPLETATEKADRIRDEQGRFAKTAEPVQDAASQVQEPEKTILPPRSWTAAAKAKFASLDPDVQQEVLRREKEIDDGKAQWDTKAEKYNKLDAVFAPVRDRLTLNGLTEDTYIRALVQADEMLRSNGPQAIQVLAQQYGINLAAMFGQQGGPQTQPITGQPDPQYQALQQRFDQLQARLDQGDQARVQSEQQATQAQIDAFANDPKNLYFDNVKPEMAALLGSGSAKDLQSAYEMACYARPDIRVLIAANAVTKAPTQQTKPGGPQVTGAQKGAVKPNGIDPDSSIRDDIRAAMMEVNGRV